MFSGADLSGLSHRRGTALKQFVLWLCLSATLGAQQITNSQWQNMPVGAVTPATTAPGVPQLPLFWADNHECDGSYDVTKEIGVDYTNNAAGLNQAILDWFNAADQRWHVVGAAGLTTSVTSQVTLLGKVGATKCLVFETKNSTLPANQTVCSHKILDNSDGSSPRNLGCSNDKAAMWVLQADWSPGNNGMLVQACTLDSTNCSVGPNHYVFKNVEMREASTRTDLGFLVNLDDGDTAGNRGSSHIWFIQDFIHGDATDSGVGQNMISALIRFRSATYSGVAYSYMDECVSIGNPESHIFTVQWSPGPLKFVHNWLEGCSIPLFAGGTSDSLQLPYSNTFDVEVRGNRFTKPAAWLNIPAGGLALKSDGELKTASRWLYDGNIFENSSTNGGQQGQCFTMTVRNSSGSTPGDNYSASVNDITVTNFVCRHAVAGISLDAHSGGFGNGNGATQGIQRIAVSNGLFYDIDPAGIFSTSVNHPHIIQLGSSSNSWIGTASCNPAGTIATLKLADGGAGAHQTATYADDLVNVQACSDPSFNTPTRSGGAFIAEGPHALAGTISSGLTVVYPIACTANATATGCTFSNEQGYPTFYSAQHLTVIGSPVKSPRIPSCNQIDRYALNFSFQNNLVAFNPSTYDGLICQGDGNAEGTTSEADMFDTATGIFNHNTYPGRTASNYTDWPGNVSPSTANWFPANVVCSGLTWDASCIGFVGMMGGTDSGDYEPNAALISDYDLVATSAYLAGGARQASDGLQVGWSRTQFLTAAQATKYTCATPCGAGPKQD